MGFKAFNGNVTAVWLDDYVIGSLLQLNIDVVHFNILAKWVSHEE
jgi:hypothetical protein